MMKDLRELTHADVVAIQDAVNDAANLSDEAKRALALHDNMIMLGLMNDFVHLMDIVELDAVRIMEVKNLRLSKEGKKQREGAESFHRMIKRVLQRNIDECIEEINKIEGEVGLDDE